MGRFESNFCSTSCDQHAATAASFPIQVLPHPPMKSFVIFFRQSPRPFTEAELGRRQREVSAWARVQNAAGHKLEPRILGPDVMRPGSEANGTGSGGWPITALLFLEANKL